MDVPLEAILSAAGRVQDAITALERQLDAGPQPAAVLLALKDAWRQFRDQALAAVVPLCEGSARRAAGRERLGPPPSGSAASARGRPGVPPAGRLTRRGA